MLEDIMKGFKLSCCKTLVNFSYIKNLNSLYAYRMICMEGSGFNAGFFLKIMTTICTQLLKLFLL